MTDTEVIRALRELGWRVYNVYGHPDITIAATLGAGTVGAADVQALGRKLGVAE